MTSLRKHKLIGHHVNSVLRAFAFPDVSQTFFDPALHIHRLVPMFFELIAVANTDSRCKDLAMLSDIRCKEPEGPFRLYACHLCVDTWHHQVSE
jgi:hypothetical protein